MLSTTKHAAVPRGIEQSVHPSAGFSLIELMIVVAIIAILAAIGLSAYQDYLAKSQVAAGLAEINGARAAYEIAVNDAKPGDFYTTSNVGLAENSHRCATKSVHEPIGGAATPALTCTLTGAPRVDRAVIGLSRGADGSWTCTIDPSDGWKSAYTPAGCTTA